MNPKPDPGSRLFLSNLQKQPGEEGLDFLVRAILDYLGSVPKMRFFRATHVARYRIAKILILKLHL
jgi:hypothetical protein